MGDYTVATGEKALYYAAIAGVKAGTMAERTAGTRKSTPKAGGAGVSAPRRPVPAQPAPARSAPVRPAPVTSASVLTASVRPASAQTVPNRPAPVRPASVAVSPAPSVTPVASTATAASNGHGTTERPAMTAHYIRSRIGKI